MTGSFWDPGKRKTGVLVLFSVVVVAGQNRGGVPSLADREAVRQVHYPLRIDCHHVVGSNRLFFQVIVYEMAFSFHLLDATI